MKQSDKRARTRSALVREARRAFARDGYDGTTLDVVAAAAGYSKGALFANFASKLDLFLDVARDALADREARVRACALAAQLGLPPARAAEAYWDDDRDETHARLMLCLWNEAARQAPVRALVDDQAAALRLLVPPAEEATLLGHIAHATIERAMHAAGQGVARLAA